MTLRWFQRFQGFQRDQRFRGRAEIEALAVKLYELTKGEIGVVEGV